MLPLVIAMWLGGKPRRPLTPATFPVAHSDVELRAKDGTKLSGWYVPSRNGAAVVLVHGGGGDRNGVRRHALLLARHGYGVLLYDERGRGRSGGTNEAMGWNWVQDVEAAVDYVRSRGVRRIGALGLSTGAEVVVAAAAHDPRIEAVVAPAWKRAAGPTAALWIVAAGHTQALATFPRAYERRVVGLFGRALLRRP